MHFDLTDLRLFLRVVEAGSITGGATAAGLALASASARVSGMEAKAGALLLERGRRGIVPTEAGLVLAEHARAVIRQMERMRGDLGAFAAGLKGRVRIAANTAGMIDTLPEALARFIASNPSVDLDLTEMSSVDVVRAVARDTADIGIAADHADMHGLERVPFQADRLVLAVPLGHPLALRRRITFADALSFDFVGLSSGSALQQHLSDHAHRAGERMRLRARVGGFDLLCRMVCSGAGIAVVPAAVASRQGVTDHLATVALDDAWAKRRLYLLSRRRSTFSAHAERLYAHLAAAGETMGGSECLPNGPDGFSAGSG